MRPALLALVALLLAAPAAEAAFFGSSLRQPANAGFGCESVPSTNPFTGAPGLTPSGFGSCTVRSVGRIGSFRAWSAVPADGRVVSWSVRSGANPAPLRLSIVSASVRPNGRGGGDYLCCTGRVSSTVMRPRPNRITTRRVDFGVTRDKEDGVEFFDQVVLSAVGPGTLPLRDEGTAGSYQQGSALSAFYYPAFRRGQSNVDYAQADGVELLLRWDFRRAR